MTNSEYPRPDPGRPQRAIDAPTGTESPHSGEIQPKLEPTHEMPQTGPDAASVTQSGIDHYGNAFRAFLRLPDVRADDPELVDMFQDAYVGQFFSMDEIIDSLTEAADWEVEISSLAERLGIPGYITLDRAMIADRVRDAWDIVPFDGALYVFIQ